eukprot:CAMPEP_0185545184 /NCGR_PEP_ID=MMETSP1381-20130426/4589_1 /TAXON_ID=298111 /ORGANISM="Pavlova sp., Strain CCMP459" /LENGTH=69 /DNA_ID=CAMNT_0028157471 /DNA_START=197 /DNA_END=404 /DNA_ORIENTATION=+
MQSIAYLKEGGDDGSNLSRAVSDTVHRHVGRAAPGPAWALEPCTLVLAYDSAPNCMRAPCPHSMPQLRH